MLATFIQIAAGGALGAVLRHLTRIWIELKFAADFPYATLIVNAGGSFLAGVLFVVLGGLTDQTSRFLPFLIIGFFGGYTTFSAYSLDAWMLFQQGRMYEAMIYVAGTVVLSLIGVFAGIFIAKLLFT